MAKLQHSPGTVRDAIVAYLDLTRGEASVSEITRAVEASIGDVPASSVRSYLRLRPDVFRRTRHGRYQLKTEYESGMIAAGKQETGDAEPALIHGTATLYQDDCFDWLERCDENSIHAVVTDPPMAWSNTRKPSNANFGRAKAGFGGFPRPLTAIGDLPSRASRP